MSALPLQRLLACAAALLSACSSTPTQFHSLTQVHRTLDRSPAEPDSIACTFDSPASTSQEAVGSILLAHVAVPVQVERMQLVVHQTPTRLAVYESERWAAPVADQISVILIGNLRAELPRVSITSDPLLVGAGAPLQLNMDIEELDAVAGKEATIRARWRLSVSDGTASQTGSCIARQPVRGTTIDELVLAWSRALADISSEIATCIQRWVGS